MMSTETPAASRSGRQALLQTLLRERGLEMPAQERIQRRPHGAPAPLSWSQERFWFLDQLQPGSPAYNVPIAFPQPGAVDPEALEWALGRIVQRHEALRSVFGEDGGELVQRVVPGAMVPLEVEDLRERPADERQAVARRRIAELSAAPFDLSRGPLLRVALLRISDEEAVLVANFHHIIADAWSLEIFGRELGFFYAARMEGDPGALPELPIQYGDYARWQRSYLQGETLEEHLEYWRRQLTGLPEILELPSDRPRPAVQTFRGAWLPQELPRDLWDAVGEESRQAGATPFMTLLAAFAVLLGRLSGQRELAVGTPVANRDRLEVQDLIGLFLNTLVLRADLGERPTFRQLLAQVRQTTLGAYAHQELPFEQVVDELQPARNLSANPLFQVMFVLNSSSRARGEAAEESEGDTAPCRELEVGASELATGTSKFDLSLYVSDAGGGLSAGWEYSVDLFDRTTMSRWSRHFSTLLEAIVQDPERSTFDLPLLSAAESQQIREANDTARAWHVESRWGESGPQEVAPHQLFQSQAEATPDAVAVVLGETSLTYGTLDELATRLALRLRERGVGPEVPVGISVERSLEMVVGLLAILKSGGVHTPLDPDYPAERLSFMIADRRVPLLLTQSHLVERLPAAEAEILLLEDAADPARAPGPESPETRLPEALPPESLGYVLFTSGSTGRPKGVGMSQAALCNLILWENQLGTYEAGWRTLQFNSFSFDVSFSEILSTLSSAGCLVLLEDEERTDLHRLAELLVRRRVERLLLPYTALEHLASAALADRRTGFALRQVVSTGEALQVTESLTQFFRGLPGCALHNGYGPTETHWITDHPLSPRVEEWSALPQIGRPIPNAEVWVLGPDLSPQPVGAPGELFGSGRGVARGYLGRPAQTAASFLPDPFSGRSGSRLYRTGDLVRRRPDGGLDFLGRIDRQVKVRGFRVELGEIEVRLAEHPGVRAAAVAAWPVGRRNEIRLVAYVVGEGEELPSEELRDFLARSLPEHAVPALFVPLPELPLGATGKVDRRRLPEPTDLRPALASDYVSPRTSLERDLAALWQEALGVARVGIEDNFFELGGHSLLATQIITRLRKGFGAQLALRRLFESPTVRELSVALVQEQATLLGEDELALLLDEVEGIAPPAAAAGDEPAAGSSLA